MDNATRGLHGPSELCTEYTGITSQKMKICIKDFFNKCV